MVRSKYYFTVGKAVTFLKNLSEATNRSSYNKQQLRRMAFANSGKSRIFIKLLLLEQ